ncbi:Ion channel CASTOR [Balamuthia mandrillaris]
MRKEETALRNNGGQGWSAATSPGLAERLHYKVDFYLSGSRYARFILLGTVSLALTLLCACLAYVVLGRDSHHHPDFSFGEAMWWAMVRMIDTGALESEDVAPASRLLSVFATLCGLAVVASLIGLVNATLEEKFEELRRGKSKVIDRNHTLILGFQQEKLLAILAELREIQRNEQGQAHREKGRKGRSVVVLSEVDKLQVEAIIREHLGSMLNTSVVVRQGSVYSPIDLRKVGAERARSIIVLTDDNDSDSGSNGDGNGNCNNGDNDTRLRDIGAIKTLLALRRIDGVLHNNYVVIELQDSSRRAVVERLGKNRTKVVNMSETLSKILVQTSRQRGLAAIYADLLTFVGSEFYYKNFPELEGVAFGRVQSMMNGAVVLGVQRTKEKNLSFTILNPKDDFVIRAEDDILVISECGGTFALTGNFSFAVPDSLQRDAAGEKKRRKKHRKKKQQQMKKQRQKMKEEGEKKNEAVTTHHKMETFLICGYGRKLPAVLTEFDRYLGPGSAIYIMLGLPNKQERPAIEELKALPLRNITLSFVNGDPTTPQGLRQLVGTTFEELKCTIVLANDHLPSEEADAHTIITVLLLSELLDDMFACATRKRKRKPRIICEIMDTRSKDLLSQDEGVEFVLSTLITSRLITQISEQPGISEVFAELFAEEGNEIYIKPASLYAPLDVPFSWLTVQAVARQYHQIAIGYTYGLERIPVINPPQSEPITFTRQHKVVVVAEDEEDD